MSCHCTLYIQLTTSFGNKSSNSHTLTQFSSIHLQKWHKSKWHFCNIQNITMMNKSMQHIYDIYINHKYSLKTIFNIYIILYIYIYNIYIKYVYIYTCVEDIVKNIYCILYIQYMPIIYDYICVQIYINEYLSSSSVIDVVQSLIVCVVFCRELFVLSLLVIVLSVFIWLTDSDYSFGVLKFVFSIKMPRLS